MRRTAPAHQLLRRPDGEHSAPPVEVVTHILLPQFLSDLKMERAVHQRLSDLKIGIDHLLDESANLRFENLLEVAGLAALIFDVASI